MKLFLTINANCIKIEQPLLIKGIVQNDMTDDIWIQNRVPYINTRVIATDPVGNQWLFRPYQFKKLVPVQAHYYSCIKPEEKELLFSISGKAGESFLSRYWRCISSDHVKITPFNLKGKYNFCAVYTDKELKHNYAICRQLEAEVDFLIE